MCGNVSRVLQTPKTAKNDMPFLRFHYNRDFNENGHPPMSIIPVHFWCTWKSRGKNDLPSRLFGFRSCASDMSLSYAATRFPIIHSPLASRDAELASLREVEKTIGFVTNHDMPL